MIRCFLFLDAVCFLLASREGFGGPMRFTNITTAAGISHRYNPSLETGIPSLMSGGAVAEDFNGDGFIDLYVLQGGGSPNLMYMNQGNGSFADEASMRGAALVMNGMGAAAADFDNDGDIDICVTTQFGPHFLLINNGAGFFTVNATMLTGPTNMATSPSWGDFDRDGLLDLVIGQWAGGTDENLWVYHNVGNQRLEPYPFRATPSSDAWVFSPRFADVNNDGWSDLLVTSDFGRSQIYLNQRNGLFQLLKNSGTGLDENGMGSAIGDYDNDGDLDWFVTAIYDKTGVPEGSWGVTGNRLYRNHPSTGPTGPMFSDATTVAGVRDGNWGWGSAFGDLDNDGDLDLFHVNGWSESPARFNNQPARLFENIDGDTFVDVAASAGAADSGQGRGVVLFDFDNDGDLDIFICNNHELVLQGRNRIRQPAVPTLLRNETGVSCHWLKVSLAGAPPIHRNGIGSRVYVRTKTQDPRWDISRWFTLPEKSRRANPHTGLVQMREINASTGYLAHGPERIAHFGLGNEASVAEVFVQWMNGDTTRITNIPADQHLTIASPPATLSKRSVAIGESLTASSMGIDHQLRREWVVEQRRYADPVTLFFRTAGTKALGLNLYNPANGRLVRSDGLAIEVRHRAGEELPLPRPLGWSGFLALP